MLQTGVEPFGASAALSQSFPGMPLQRHNSAFRKPCVCDFLARSMAPNRDCGVSRTGRFLVPSRSTDRKRNSVPRLGVAVRPWRREKRHRPNCRCRGCGTTRSRLELVVVRWMAHQRTAADRQGRLGQGPAGRNCLLPIRLQRLSALASAGHPYVRERNWHLVRIEDATRFMGASERSRRRSGLSANR